MKLSNSEVLLLTQLLYHVKCSDSYFEFSDQIYELHEKLCSHMLNCQQSSDLEEDNKPEHPTDIDERCVWHEDHVHHASEFEEAHDEHDEDIFLKDVLQLDSMRASHKGKKCSLFFEKGISKSSLDLNLDDGDEILCDVTHIERHTEELKIQCVSGLVSFDVQKFPKSWTALLQPGVLYKVV